MPHRLRIILVEDSLLDAELVQATLADGGLDCELVRVDARDEFVRALDDRQADLVLSDYVLPAFSGMDALELTRQRRADLPFIFVSGALGEELAIESLKKGATDYVLKQRLERLIPAVERALAERRERADRRAAEAALLKAKEQAEAASRAKDQFLAVLSHELRTPLSPVLMVVAAMELDPDLPPRLREDVSMIRRNIEIETKLIDDLLDLSRITSGKLRLNTQTAHVHRLVEQVLQMTAAEAADRRVIIHREMNAGVDTVEADPARLQQVLWNLVKNAIKFTPEGGEIWIRTAVDDARRLRLEVRDSGIGMDATTLARIFRPFEQGESRITRQFGGLGLGLAITKAIVDLHGGTIRAHSAGRGAGSTFTVTLPISIPVASHVPRRPHPPAGAAGEPRRVLLVEDHADTAKVLARLLRHSGYAVTTASTVADALDVVATENFDVIVSDLGLPDASGYDFMQRVRDRYPSRGIAMSGYGMEEDIRRSKQAGFVEHLVKPISIDLLEQAIRRITAGATPFAPLAAAEGASHQMPA